MSESELRTLVREVLVEVLKTRRPVAVPAPVTPRLEPVSIASDADLAAFVARLVTRLDEPATGAALRAGQLRFTLARPARAPATAAPAAGAAAVVLTGTVTEARVAALAGTMRVALAPGAIMTPLARDKARAMGLAIERKR